MEKTNILFLSNRFGIGGGEKKVEIFYNHFNSNYFNKFFVFFDHEKKSNFEIKDKKYLISENKLLDFIINNNINVFYCFTMKLSNAIIEEIKKICVVVFNINFFATYRHEENELNIVISKSELLKLKTNYSDLKNTKVVYNPIDTKRWIKLSENKSNNYTLYFKNKNIKLIIGRIARSEFSTWDFLTLATLIKLNYTKNYDYGFIFAGIPKIYQWIFKLLLSKKFNKYILILPELCGDEKLGKFYNSLDVFWQSSTVGESFGNVTLEAFCFKVPNIVDYKEFYKNKKTPNLKLSDAQFESSDNGKNSLFANFPSTVIKHLKFYENKDNRNKFGNHGFHKVKNIYDVKFAVVYNEKYIFDELLRRNFIDEVPIYYKNIHVFPTQSDVNNYSREYLKRIDVAKQINNVNLFSKFNYFAFKNIWTFIGFIYLSVRFILRKTFKYDIEKNKRVIK